MDMKKSRIQWLKEVKDDVLRNALITNFEVYIEKTFSSDTDRNIYRDCGCSSLASAISSAFSWSSAKIAPDGSVGTTGMSFLWKNIMNAAEKNQIELINPSISIWV